MLLKKDKYLQVRAVQRWAVACHQQEAQRRPSRTFRSTFRTTSTLRRACSRRTWASSRLTPRRTRPRRRAQASRRRQRAADRVSRGHSTVTISSSRPRTVAGHHSQARQGNRNQRSHHNRLVLKCRLIWCINSNRCIKWASTVRQNRRRRSLDLRLFNSRLLLVHLRLIWPTTVLIRQRYEII